MNRDIRLLLLEQSASNITAIEDFLDLKQIPAEVRVVSNFNELIDAVDAFRPDVVLLDHALASYEALTSLALTRKRNPALPFIYVYSEDLLVQTLRRKNNSGLREEELLTVAEAVEDALRELQRRSKAIREELYRDTEELRLNAADPLPEAVVQNFPDAILVQGPDGKYIRSYALAETRLPVFFQDLSGKSPGDLFPERLAARLEALREEAVATGKNITSEFSILIGDQHLHYEIRTLPLPAGNVVTLLRDITERVQREEKIALEHSMLQRINEAVIITDAALVITSWNHGAEDMFNLGANWVIGKNLADVFSILIPEKQYSEIRKSVDVVGAFEGSFAFRPPRKPELLLHSKIAQLKDEYGDVSGYVEIIYEKTVAALPPHEAGRFDSFNNFSAGIAVISGEDVIYANAAMEQLTGYSAKELNALGIPSVIEPDYRPAFTEFLKSVAEPGKPEDVAVALFARDGSVTPNIRCTRLGLLPAPDAGCILSFTASAAKVQQQAALTAQAFAPPAAQGIADAVQDLNWDIRSSMNGILGFADILREEFKSFKDQSFYNFAEQIFRSGQHLLTIVNENPNLNDVELRKVALKRELFPLNDAIQFAIEQLLKEAEQKGIKLNFVARSRLNVQGDRTLVTAVLRHLIHNGILYSNAGSVTVETGYDNISEHAYVKVRDTGPGIPQRIIQRVTAQAADDQNFLLTGLVDEKLDLPGCRKLILLMDGKFEIQSYPESGTVVTFSIPADEQTRGDLSAQPALFITGSPEMYYLNQIQPRFLIVEDDPNSRKMLELTLKTLSKVDFAPDGDEALRLIESQYHYGIFYDLLLFDIGLPQPWDGISLRAEVRNRWEEYKNRPFVAQTAYALQRDQQKILDAGFDGYIAKPIDRRFLIKTLAAIIKKVRESA